MKNVHIGIWISAKSGWPVRGQRQVNSDVSILITKSLSSFGLSKTSKILLGELDIVFFSVNLLTGYFNNKRGEFPLSKLIKNDYK